ncbi:MAG: hypothetical protein K2N44_13120 [Lachnospiraceae bacterium]|nr:hypothetical protein [Lachnospiraceae bacterium]MDE7417216.1 hypothetical protein [Lachnospiraceae bacterium]
MNGKNKKGLKKAIGLFFGLLVLVLPIIGPIGIRYCADVYSKKRSVIVDDCVVKSIVEAPKEILFVVELPGPEHSLLPEMRVVHAYGKREKDQQEVEIGDAVTCAFPERNTSRKGYVVW